ncbi:MAG: hypothetical protein HETSPECPRED_004100 [Heterodermia speciosa]|uniref:Uncharacterized protein n=1 Tax=Heterodermia speciosa TaxID=116794 RepID=A0A8H3FCZ2_9LECA|nr:MAG: hypothetical protein HETSPECPRED_004100 [Heterodermia speciosa]
MAPKATSSSTSSPPPKSSSNKALQRQLVGMAMQLADTGAPLLIKECKKTNPFLGSAAELAYGKVKKMQGQEEKKTGLGKAATK